MSDEGWKNSKIYGNSDFHKADLSKIKFGDDINNKILNWWKRKSDLLLFCGSVGVGKSYLGHALCRFWSENMKFPHNHYLFKLEKEIYDHLQPPYNPGFSPAYEIEKFQNIPFVVIDDFGSTKKSDFRDEILFAILDGRHSSRYPTLITTNKYVKDIRSEYSAPIVSRLLDKRNTIIELVDEDLRQSERD